MSKPCKHGHVDGARHIPCPHCRIEYLESRIRVLEQHVPDHIKAQFNPYDLNDVAKHFRSKP